MEALRQIVQLDSDTLVLKLPETFSHQRVEVIVLNQCESIETESTGLTDQWGTSRQMLETFRSKGRIFSDSAELVRESRDEALEKYK